MFTDINKDHLGSLLTDEKAVNKHIDNLLNMMPTEYWNRPVIGCNLKRFLHEPLGESTALQIIVEIKYAFANWLPHVTIVDGSGIVVDYERETYNVTVNWKINNNYLQGVYSTQLG